MSESLRSKKLKKLQNLAEVKSRKALEAVHYLQQKLYQENGKMEQLEQCKMDYVSDTPDDVTDGKIPQSAFLLKNESRFLTKLDVAMKQQKQQIQVVAAQLDKVNKHWRELDIKTQSMQRLSESAAIAEIAAAAALEQKETDNLASQSGNVGFRSRSFGQS